MGEEYLAQLVAVGITVHLLVLDNLSHLRLLFGEELVDFTASISLNFANNSLVNQVCQDGANLLLDGSLAGVHLRHHQRHHIVDGGRELLLIDILEVADHKQHISHTAIKSLFLFVIDDFKSLTCILESPLSQMLHGALERGTIETVERNELTNFHFLSFTGNGVSDIYQ